MIEVLKWPERHDQQKVTDESLWLSTVVSLDERQQGELQSQLWSFFTGCPVGLAKSQFNGVNDLNGLEAWRRAVRQIDSGTDIRLESCDGRSGLPT